MSAEEVKSKPKKGRPTIKSDQFRRFAADTFGLRVNNNMAQLLLSLETADASLDEEERVCLVQEATVILTLPSFKILTILLSKALEGLEKQGGTIQLTPGKEEQLRAKIAEKFPLKKPPTAP